MSHPAQEYARRVATDYIGFCESATESAARLFIAILHFYARDAAPSADEAEELLGPEGNATDAIRLAARELDMNFYTDPRQEAWEGFLEQVLHVQDNNEDPGSLPDNPTPAQYIERAFTGCPGADDFCQRVPWRTEALLNLARFLSQDNWTSLSTLFSFLKKYKSTYIGIDPTGIEELKSGAGSLTSGLAGFSIMSRIRLSESELGLRGKDLGQWSYIVPNRYTLDGYDRKDYTWGPETLDDISRDQGGNIVGHGTSVASLAIGQTFGMAPKANAYLIKAITTVSKRDGDNQIVEVADYSPKASLEAMHHIIEVIKDRQLQGKAVVSHSLGRYNRASGMTVTKWRAEKSVWKRQLRKLEDLGVVFIQAAGNNGYNPQNPNDQVYKTGMLMPPVLGRATNNAGLAAYFLGLEKEKFAWQPDGTKDYGRRFCQNLKNHIVDRHYRRIPMSQQYPDNPFPKMYPFPPDVPVAYNGINGKQQGVF
ncbi:putative subtilisin-like protein [Eutypa lata UCREL1]|uniref:Putative subtilisin-like protein n=1 Tax=Eutypa lata (strain UCR-EL1) TaxID=1287681 RepID=M7SWJ3_EUTLA|nr:putative subtilisin-like protein [Eutypa lata UCREL1]